MFCFVLLVFLGAVACHEQLITMHPTFSCVCVVFVFAQDIRCNAAMLMGVLLHNIPNDDRRDITKEHVCGGEDLCTFVVRNTCVRAPTHSLTRSLTHSQAAF